MFLQKDQNHHENQLLRIASNSTINYGNLHSWS